MTASAAASSRRAARAASATSKDGGVGPTDSSAKGGRVSTFVIRWLTTLTVIGCALGVALGCLCQVLQVSPDAVKVIRFPGELFVRALKAVVVPMIFASMVSNAAALGETGAANRMSGLAVKFYLSTTFLAAMEGIALFNMFRFAFDPISASGDSYASTTMPPSSEKLSILDTFLNFGRDFVPDNLCKAILETQLLGVIAFAIFLGSALSKHPQGKLVIDFFSTIFDALVWMIRQVIIFTPIGVGSLVAGSIAKSHNLASALGNIGKLLLVVVLGQGCHVFVTYSAIYAGFTRKNPFRYFAGMPKLWVTAFGTSSSAATLSTTIKTCEELGISRKAANFVLPIGCTVNMDGSAVERPIVILWIAHVAAQPVPFATQLVVAFISALMSIGGSPIPSGGVSTLLLMVEAAGVPITPTVEMLVGFCLAVEWLFDSIRTTVNVTGDAIGVAVVDAYLGGPKDDEAGKSDCESESDIESNPSLSSSDHGLL